MKNRKTNLLILIAAGLAAAACGRPEVELRLADGHRHLGATLNGSWATQLERVNPDMNTACLGRTAEIRMPDLSVNLVNYPGCSSSSAMIAKTDQYRIVGHRNGSFAVVDAANQPAGSIEILDSDTLKFNEYILQRK